MPWLKRSRSLSNPSEKIAGKDITQTCRLLFKNHGVKEYVLNAPSTRTFTSTRSTFLEEAIEWDGNGKQSRHECEHTRYSRSVQGGVFDLELVPDQPSVPNPGFYNLLAVMHKEGILPSFNPPKVEEKDKIAASLDWRAAFESLLDDASGLLPDDVSIGVNIAEFAQLKGLIRGLSRPITRILQYATKHPNRKVKKWKYLTDKSGKVIPWTMSYETVEFRSLKFCLRDLAGLDLGFQFGVLPLADDLGNWAAKYWQIKLKLDWWKRLYDGGKARVRARTPVVTSSSTKDRGFVDGYTAYPGTNFEIRQRQIYDVKTMGYLQATVYANPKRGLALQNALLAQVLGLNVPLQLAWELVPFSFIVDWFYPVKDLIRRVEPRRAIGGLCRNMVLEDVWHTVVHQAESRVELYEGAWKSVPSSDSFYAYHYTGRLIPGALKETYRTYSRLRGMPALNFFPVAKSRFGLKQALTSIALIVQRVVGH